MGLYIENCALRMPCPIIPDESLLSHTDTQNDELTTTADPSSMTALFQPFYGPKHGILSLTQSKISQTPVFFIRTLASLHGDFIIFSRSSKLSSEFFLFQYTVHNINM